MAGRKKYPDGFNDELWRLLVAGKKPKQIREALATGETNLGRPVEISIRTIARRIAALKDERGEPIDTVPEGQEQATLAEMERSMMAIANAEIRRLQARSRAGPLEVNDITKLERLVKVKRQLATPQARGNGAPSEAASSSVLDDMDGNEAVSKDPPTSEGEALLGEGEGGAREETKHDNGLSTPRSLASEHDKPLRPSIPAHA